MSIKALVLLSGGLDSVYNLYAANKKWPGQVSAVFFNYGQKALDNELKAASLFTQNLNIPMQVIDLTGVFSGDPSSLTSESLIPTTEVDIESPSASVASAQSVWVANRNGVFLNVAACLAEKMGISWIVPGFNREEAETFPDNSEDYIEKINSTLLLSTANGVQVFCFSQKLDKSQIIVQAKALGVTLEKIWSCYHSGGVQCGRCESCQRFNRAMKNMKG